MSEYTITDESLELTKQTLRERAEAFLKEPVPAPYMEHTPYGEVYHNVPPLELSPVDLGIIADQQALMRVIAGLQDTLGSETETEEEANDFDWEEPDPLVTPHTIREMVEEEPLDTAVSKTPEAETVPPKGDVADVKS